MNLVTRSWWQGTHGLIAATVVVLVTLLAGCRPKRDSTADTAVQHEFLAHPDNAKDQIEIFWARPVGAGPWPAIVFLHGHQDPPPGSAGKDFVQWGVLAAAVQRGYVAIAISQPGYGASDGPADFCGPLTQRAVASVIRHFRAQSFVSPTKVGIEGISRGAIVAALVGAHDPELAALVLISGVYDLSAIPAGPIADAMKREGVLAKGDLNDRSALFIADRIRTATLILNGAKDDRTFPDQARSLAARIQEHGTTAKAVVYPEFGHAIPPQVRAKEIDAFLDEHLARPRSD